jgi:hypothetical protein
VLEKKKKKKLFATFIPVRQEKSTQRKKVVVPSVDEVLDLVMGDFRWLHCGPPLVLQKKKKKPQSVRTEHRAACFWGDIYTRVIKELSFTQNTNKRIAAHSSTISRFQDTPRRGSDKVSFFFFFFLPKYVYNVRATGALCVSLSTLKFYDWWSCLHKA